jgi:hypothetical protein
MAEAMKAARRCSAAMVAIKLGYVWQKSCHIDVEISGNKDEQRGYTVRERALLVAGAVSAVCI